MAIVVRQSLIKQFLSALIFVAGLAMASVPAWAEFDPGLSRQLFPAADSSTVNVIGATLSAEDSSGATADWKFLYNQTSDPTHVKVQATVSDADGSEKTYSTTIDSDGVDDLIQWLTQVQHQMATHNSR